MLSKSAGKADIMIFQNSWESDALVSRYLRNGSYFFAFPGEAGGGRCGHHGNYIESVIMRTSTSTTVMGEVSGAFTERLKMAAVRF